MLSATINRGDLHFPRVIEDSFNRPNSTNLGRTSVGWVPWFRLRGAWEIASNRLRISTGSVNPVAVVNARSSDVEVTIDVSTQSGDGLVLRATDHRNFLRVANYFHSYTEPVGYNQYRWTSSYAKPPDWTEYQWEGVWANYAIPGWHNHIGGGYSWGSIPDTQNISNWHDVKGAHPIVKRMWSKQNDACPFPPDPEYRLVQPPGTIRGTGEIHSHAVYHDDVTSFEHDKPAAMSTHRHPRTSCELTGNTRTVSSYPEGPTHTHTFNSWVNSETTSPHATSITHSHNGGATHTHQRSSSSVIDTRFVQTSTLTHTTRRLHLEKMENGSLTEIAQWNVPSTSRIRVVAIGSALDIYGGNGTSLAGSETVTFNQNAVLHGVSRRLSGHQGTALDNFRVVWQE